MPAAKITTEATAFKIQFRDQKANAGTQLAYFNRNSVEQVTLEERGRIVRVLMPIEGILQGSIPSLELSIDGAGGSIQVADFDGVTPGGTPALTNQKIAEMFAAGIIP